MKPDALLAELERVAAALDIKVTYEAMGASVGHGGLCRVKGQYRIIIDRRAATSERIPTLAKALARFDVSAMDLTPKARDVVNHFEAKRAVG